MLNKIELYLFNILNYTPLSHINLATLQIANARNKRIAIDGVQDAYYTEV